MKNTQELQQQQQICTQHMDNNTTVIASSNLLSLCIGDELCHKHQQITQQPKYLNINM